MSAITERGSPPTMSHKFGTLAGASAYPLGFAPRARSHRYSHAPLNPVCPVIRTRRSRQNSDDVARSADTNAPIGSGLAGLPIRFERAQRRPHAPQPQSTAEPDLHVQESAQISHQQEHIFVLASSFGGIGDLQRIADDGHRQLVDSRPCRERIAHSRDETSMAGEDPGGGAPHYGYFFFT